MSSRQVSSASAGGEVVWGVDLAYLRNFYEERIQEHPDQSDQLTTDDVVETIIKPLTEHTKLAYIEQDEQESGDTLMKVAVGGTYWLALTYGFGVLASNPTSSTQQRASYPLLVITNDKINSELPRMSS